MTPRARATLVGGLTAGVVVAVFLLDGWACWRRQAPRKRLEVDAKSLLCRRSPGVSVADFMDEVGESRPFGPVARVLGRLLSTRGFRVYDNAALGWSEERPFVAIWYADELGRSVFSLIGDPVMCISGEGGFVEHFEPIVAAFSDLGPFALVDDYTGYDPEKLFATQQDPD